jgi:ribosomal protein S12 methylthiotransferase accessory factor
VKIGTQEHRQAKSHLTSGTHRARSPAATLRAYSPFMPQMGITRLANITGLDRIGIPVYVAIRPNSRSLAVSQGKGIDGDHAKASALMESMELWHAEHIDAPMRVESYWVLAEETKVADVFRLPRRGGASLRPELPIPWIQGYDLLQAEPTWVPFEVTSMNTVLALTAPPTYFTSSNGLASGNNLLEALLHALLEVIERDSLAEWSDLPPERRAATKVDVTTISDPECREMLERYERARQEVSLWDITSAILGLPAYMCVIGDQDESGPWRTLGLFRGYGCHTDARVALARALAEAAQSRLTIISGSREDNPPSSYAAAKESRYVALQRAFFFKDKGTVSFAARPGMFTPTFEGDIEVVLQGLRRRGIEQAVFVDLTKPTLGIPVVKVTVPGLHIGGGVRAPVPQDPLERRRHR